MAMRFGEDDEDIEILLRGCAIRSAEEALDVLKRLYPAKEPPAKTRFFLEELLGSYVAPRFAPRLGLPSRPHIQRNPEN